LDTYNTPDTGARPYRAYTNNAATLAFTQSRTLEDRGIQLKKINTESLADGQQLLSVDAGLYKDFLYSAGMDMDAVCQPLIGAALPSKLFPDYLPYDYLHKKTASLFVGTRGSGLPIPQTKKLAITHERPASIANAKLSRFRVLLLKAKTPIRYYVISLFYISFLFIHFYHF